MIQSFLVASALRDFLRAKRLIAWLIVAGLVFAASKLWINLMPGLAPAEAYARLSSVFVYRLLPLAGAIFATAIIGQEVEQKTIVYLLTRPIRRQTLLLSRSLAAAIVVFGIGLVGALSVALAAFGPSPKMLGPLSQDFVALAVGSLAYVALFLLVSLFLNKAMVVCLLYAFGWEPSVGNMPGDLYYLSVNSYLTAIGSPPAKGSGNPLMDAVSGMLGLKMVTPQTAWIVLAAIILGGFAFAAWWFKTHEYVPREDAE